MLLIELIMSNTLAGIRTSSTFLGLLGNLGTVGRSGTFKHSYSFHVNLVCMYLVLVDTITLYQLSVDSFY